MTERHATIHAARALFTQIRLRHLLMKLFPVVYPSGRRSRDRKTACVFHETCGLTHKRLPIADCRLPIYTIANFQLSFRSYLSPSPLESRGQIHGKEPSSIFRSAIGNRKSAMLHFPPTRATSCEFNSKAAISASS